LDFGIIGNCHYNALINTKGEVVWLCWPRFDSSFVFGSLLDGERGGEYSICAPDGSPGRQTYLPNTNVLRTVFESEKGAFEVIDFAPRFLLFNRYYKPNMLVRIVRPLSGEPAARVRIAPRYDYGLIECSSTMGSNHIAFRGAPEEIRLTTNASLEWVMEGRPFSVDRNMYFTLTYGPPLEEDLPHTCERLLDQTKSYWKTWIKHAHLPLEFQEEAIRSALALKLHQFEDTGAITAASTTSIPEAKGTVRNWDYRYCWLRDALFSLLALRRLTHFEEMEGFLVYLRNIAETMDQTEGRLQPVYGISGEARLLERTLDHLSGYRGHKPVRVGNQAFEHLQHDVYGEMILAISQLFLDRRFVDNGFGLPIQLLQKLVDKVEEFLEAKDAGLWEFRGIAQLHTFTVLMHWAGAAMAEQVSIVHGYAELHKKAHDLRQRSARIINERCWDDKIQAFTQAAEQPALDAALLMMVNLGFLRADDPRAHSHVDAIARNLSASDGYLRRYAVKDDFGETHNAFTICSFWLAEAYARLGRREEGLELFRKLLARGNHLGLYSEDLDPKTGEQWGNFPQTYSHVGLINAAFALSRDDSGLGFFSPFDLDD